MFKIHIFIAYKFLNIIQLACIGIIVRKKDPKIQQNT